MEWYRQSQKTPVKKPKVGQVGKLEVWDPTKEFLGWLKSENIYYQKEKEGVDIKITIEKYRLGGYKGIVGVSAEFDGELI